MDNLKLNVFALAVEHLLTAHVKHQSDSGAESLLREVKILNEAHRGVVNNVGAVDNEGDSPRTGSLAANGGEMAQLTEEERSKLSEINGAALGEPISEEAVLRLRAEAGQLASGRGLASATLEVGEPKK